MFDKLFGPVIPYDISLFHLINGLPHFAIIDLLFVGLAGITTLGIFWVFIAAYYSKKIKDNRLFRLSLLYAIIGYPLVEVFLKNLFGRSRPSIVIFDTIIVGPKVAEFFQQFSFPSGHAFLAFGFIVLFTYFNKKLFWPFFWFAFLVGFSRVYLGKHYPIDVLVGGGLGYLIGKIILRGYLWVEKRKK